VAARFIDKTTYTTSMALVRDVLAEDPGAR